MPAPLPPLATPGNVVGEKYVLEAVIGRGGMGVVMSARHVTLGKRVAVKLLLAEADENARARFELEAQAAAVLASPHIAQVLDFGVTRDGLAYLVMEFLDGRDLQVEKRLRSRLPITEAVDVVLEASVGVALAHAAGLVHRDIKPANVFLAQVAGRRVVKILDFGLIKVMSEGAASLTGTTETFGTPKYMAPEQLRSARSVDARADQHALAAILFETITGRPPFDGESVPDIIIKIGTEPAPLASSVGVAVPAALEAALQRAMAKRPEHRFPTLAEFAATIAPFGTARAAELAAEIERCLASPLVRRPLLRDELRQDELRSTVQMPRPSIHGAPAPTPSLEPTARVGLASTSLPTPASAGYGATHTASLAAQSPQEPSTVASPRDPPYPGSSTLSSSSVETFRVPRAAFAPSASVKAVAVAAIAASLGVGALVFALQRSAGSTSEGAAAAAPSTTSASAGEVRAGASDASAAQPLDPAPALQPVDSATAATGSGAPSASGPPSASGAPSASGPQSAAPPKPTQTTLRRPTPPAPPAPSHKPCASLDCLGN